jgi:hypothetical protein
MKAEPMQPKTLPEASRDWCGGKISTHALRKAIHDDMNPLKAFKPRGCKSWLVEKLDLDAWKENEKCRVQNQRRGFSSSAHLQVNTCGLSVTERDAEALASIRATIKAHRKPSRATSPKSGKPPKA